ncbi:MAG TPA: hypothetical protein VG015_06755 [Candidatus Dormibacteraeota bacterium]|nr:hypothetical protein [Candidatus Dormibacteraeota bacterium]
MKLLHFLPDEEDEDLQTQAAAAASEQPAIKVKSDRVPWPALLLLWTLALGPRLFVLFFVTNPENAGAGWHGDVYHHWQIAYLTKEIGLFDPSGPRLWDLKGLDYFWGILHPILLVILFFLTGSIDIVIPRLLASFMGAVVVVLIFSLCRRHWGYKVAVPAAAFAAISPVAVFVDSTGFLEPLGVAMVLFGIWCWPKKGLWTGIAFALAAMARAEAWLFSFGMIVAAFLKPKDPTTGVPKLAVQRVPLAMAWVIGILIYMKILLDRTGNPIYPVWENFLVNAFGQWEFRGSLSPDEVHIRPYLGVLLALGILGLIITLWKRPKSYMFLTFGFGYLVFTAFFLGYTAYLESWENWFWQERFFDFPYEFGAVLIALILFVVIPKRLGKMFLPVAWGLAAFGLVASQLEWSPILALYAPTAITWNHNLQDGKYLGALYHSSPAYEAGVLNMPPDPPELVYAMARYDNLDGRHIMGQLYDPFYPQYLPPHFRYSDHPDLGDTLLQCWLLKTNSTLFAVDKSSVNYLRLLRDQPDWFPQVGAVPNEGWQVYAVNVPKLSKAACAANVTAVTQVGS